jgi:PIN domain
VLETRKVFIDTQYYVKAGLHFDTPALKSFRKLCESDELIHVTTSVVNREVESNIQLSVKDALNAMQTFRRKARLLCSLADEQIQALFVEISEEDIYKKASDVFEEFINGCKTEIVSASELDAEDVLHLYFDKKPPFGEGKKKSEFPDALSLFSLKSHLKEEEKLYVVSEDGDMKSFCYTDPQLVLVESLDKVLDIYSQHTNIRTNQVKKYFLSTEEVIKARVKEQLEKCDVYNSSTWEDAEVDDGLTVTHVGEVDPSVIYISDEEAQVTFDIDVEFEVTVTGPAFNNVIYDRQDGRVYTFDTNSRTSTISKTYTVEIWLSYEFLNGNLENVKENEFHIAGVSGGIEVAVEEN